VLIAPCAGSSPTPLSNLPPHPLWGCGKGLCASHETNGARARRVGVQGGPLRELVDALVSLLSDTGRVLAELRAPSLGHHIVTRLREASSAGPISAAAFVQVRFKPCAQAVQSSARRDRRK